MQFTHEDNPYLPELQRSMLVSRGKIDKYFHRVYVKGLVGKREGLVYSDYEQVDNFPDEIDYCYGLDFGFNNPCALTKVGANERNLYWEEVLYEQNLTPDELVKRLEKLIPNKKKEILADPSRPELIETIFMAGFNIKKATNEVIEGINFVKNFHLHITKISTNLLNEIKMYHWKEDKNGKILEEPVKFNDHAIDAGRYGTQAFRSPKLPSSFHFHKKQVQ